MYHQINGIEAAGCKDADSAREPVLLPESLLNDDDQPLAASLPKVKHRQYLPFAEPKMISMRIDMTSKITAQQFSYKSKREK